jgi:hypothetical protein
MVYLFDFKKKMVKRRMVRSELKNCCRKALGLFIQSGDDRTRVEFKPVALLFLY